MFVLDRSVRPVAGSRTRTVRVAAVRAAELDHETFDDAVEMESVVKARLRELHEVTRCLRHLVGVELGGELTERDLKRCSGVRHETATLPRSETHRDFALERGTRPARRGSSGTS